MIYANLCVLDSVIIDTVLEDTITIGLLKQSLSLLACSLAQKKVTNNLPKTRNFSDQFSHFLRWFQDSVMVYYISSRLLCSFIINILHLFNVSKLKFFLKNVTTSFLLINQVWGVKTTRNKKAMKQFPPTQTVSEYIYILIILHIVLYLLFAWHFIAYKVLSYSWFNLIFTTILSLFHITLDWYGVAIENTKL